MTEPLLSMRDVSVTYHGSGGAVPAVRRVSLDLERGGSLGLAGESGCGKSTLANSILRLLPPDAVVEGHIVLDGKDVLSLRPGGLRAARWTAGAIVFQGALHALNPVQTVGRQIAEPMLIHGTVPDEEAAERRTVELLGRVGLPAARADSYPHQLSGGQRQRVLIAMALACEPMLLIADEPTTALDLMVQAQVLRLLEELKEEHDLTLLFITHDLSVLTYACRDLAVMYAGRIVEDGPSWEVFGGPAHPYTKGLAAAFPTIGDPSSRMAPSGLGGDPPMPGSLPVGCPFNPRCPYATEACLEAEPELRIAGTDRRAACILV
ncbi:MAG: ABC transporter ATP-binding protein [Actinobacteria bacterium]|nr:ABC transporter ATP-binding protein [Actinomycetota bacterium]MCI0679118.1 ABC transporter ATP-binding protein [Actinomycetota bacterium]